MCPKKEKSFEDQRLTLTLHELVVHAVWETVGLKDDWRFGLHNQDGGPEWTRCITLCIIHPGPTTLIVDSADVGDDSSSAYAD